MLNKYIKLVLSIFLSSVLSINFIIAKEEDFNSYSKSELGFEYELVSYSELIAAIASADSDSIGRSLGLEKLIILGFDINAEFELEWSFDDYDSRIVTPLSLAIRDAVGAAKSLFNCMDTSHFDDMIKSIRVEDREDFKLYIEKVKKPIYDAFNIVKLLISNKASVDYANASGQTLLHGASTKQAFVFVEDNEQNIFIIEGVSVDILKLLIENTENIDSVDKEGRTPLHYAASCGLLSDKNKFKEYFFVDTFFSNMLNDFRLEIYEGYVDDKVINLHTEEYDIARLGLFVPDDKIKLLIDLGGADINFKDYKGRTPLHYAAMVGNLSAAKLLISKGANINAEDNDKKRPLKYAGCPEMVELLETLGATEK